MSDRFDTGVDRLCEKFALTVDKSAAALWRVSKMAWRHLLMIPGVIIFALIVLLGCLLFITFTLAGHLTPMECLRTTRSTIEDISDIFQI